MLKNTAVAPLFAALVLALAAPSAFAGTRYTSPSGSGTTCSSASPCSIQTAFSGSADGDEIVVGSGDYGSAAAPMHDQLNADWKRVDVHGVAGQPLPRIYSDAPDHVMMLLAYNSTVANLDLHYTGGAGEALVGSFSSLDHVRVHSNGGGVTAQSGSASLTMTDVSAYANGDGSGQAAIQIVEYATTSFHATLRNVTAMTPNPNSGGLEISGGSNTADPAANTVGVTNSILRGGGTFDVAAGTTAANVTTTVNLDHSNYSTVLRYGPGTTTVTDPATNNNQTDTPLFADAANGDLHQAANSPTVDKGVTDAQNGATDIDGDARAAGASTDIGADEYVPPTPPPGDGGDQGGQADQPGSPTTGDPGQVGGSQPGGGQTATQGTTTGASAAMCVVPKLAGKTLKAAKAALAKAHCTLGKIARKSSPRKAGRVVKQLVKPGNRIKAGAKVGVVLGRR